jgi:hypothetical protein
LLPAPRRQACPAIVAERKHVFASLMNSVREAREGLGQHKPQDLMKSLQGEEGSRGDPFSRPYINVVRMHLLIFFFFACHMLKVESFLVYMVVYFVYFFPWKAFRGDAQRTPAAG